MAYLTKGESKFEQVTAGDQPAVISAFADIGTNSTRFGDRSQCRITYVLAETNSNGQQKRLSQTLTASLHEKAKLSAVLTALLGSVPDEFNPEMIVGKQVILTMGEIVRDGKTRTRLYDVKPAPESQSVQIPSGK